ncbi:MAG: hypothetical protein ACLS4A_00310 [Oscillospiraceae bacterium]
MMAFAVIGSLPIVLLFIFLQKHMIAGLTAGASKGISICRCMTDYGTENAAKKRRKHPAPLRVLSGWW